MICSNCGKDLNYSFLKENNYICDSCKHYIRIPASDRIEMVTDPDSFEEWHTNIGGMSVEITEEYKSQLDQAKEMTCMDEAVAVGKASIGGKAVCIGVCDARFIMGSMGYVMGEKLTGAFETATAKRLPVILFCCSGGARMQEGIISLMQMEKVSAAIARHDEAGLFFCSVLTDPSMGGVTASFAMLGDIILAEPGAAIGFAGKRVIRQTIGKELPEGFQTAEYLEKHGMIDAIIDRSHLKNKLHMLLKMNECLDKYANFENDDDLESHVHNRQTECPASHAPLTAWEKVKKARNAERITILEYIDKIFDNFIELKGDRLYGDDRAIIGGIAFFCGRPVTVITVDRGSSVEECLDKNFGMPNPEGYRKALRLMKQAEKYNRPVICFINTPGAYCGIEAEERGQGRAIASNLFEMSKLKVPILSIISGEAGSGGALALAVGNEVWMLENSTYSILTPEGYASILWKDSSRGEEAAARMHMEAEDLIRIGIIDDIVPEYGEDSSTELKAVSAEIKKRVISFMKKYDGMSSEEIVEERFRRFRKL